MILYRYIIREHIYPFLVSLVIIVFLFIMQQAVVLLDKIISKGLDPGIVFEIFVIQLGWIIALAIPMATLVATLTTFGRMAGDNEVTSIKASGQSMLRILIPVFAAASIVAVLLIYFNDYILPDANHRTANLLSDISRKKPAAFIEPKILIRDFSGYAIYVDEVDSRTGDLVDVRVFTDAPGQDPSTTMASRGRINLTADGQYLELTLHDGETHTISSQKEADYVVVKFKKQVVFIKNVESKLERTNSSYRSDREKNSKTMLTEVKDLETANEGYYKEFNTVIDSVIARFNLYDSLKSIPTKLKPSNVKSMEEWAKTVFASSGKVRDELNRENEYVDRVIRRIKSNQQMIAMYMVEVHKKFAIPFACIVFVLIGAPLGIMARRGGITIGAAYSVLFFIINWAMLIGGESLADKMIISPALAMWSGNILVGVIGIILLILMMRETTINFTSVILFWRKFSAGNRKWFHSVFDVIFYIPKMILQAPRWISRKLFRTLPTYLIGSFVGYIFGLLLAILVVFIITDYVGNLRKFEGARFIEVFSFYVYCLPWLIQLLFPLVLLMATMFSIGQMARNSEITAMKSAGINMRQLTSCLLIIGIFLSGMSFYLGELIIPDANMKRREIQDSMGQDEAVRAEKRKTSTKIREFRRNFYYFGSNSSIYMFEEFSTLPQSFRGIWRQTLTKNGIVERIEAQEMTYDKSKWRFLNGKRRVFEGGTAKIFPFDTLYDTVLQMAPDRMVMKIKSKEEMSYWELKGFIDAASKRGEKIQKHLAELDFKIAYPFMNFIVILLGIAITSRAGRKGSAMLFGIGLGLTFAYWIIARFSIVFAQNGYLTPMFGAWLGNILFLLIGLLLYRKASQ